MVNEGSMSRGTARDTIIPAHNFIALPLATTAALGDEGKEEGGEIRSLASCKSPTCASVWSPPILASSYSSSSPMGSYVLLSLR